MKLILIGLIINTVIYAKSIDVSNNNGVFIVEEMTVYNLNANKNGFIQLDKIPSTCGNVHLLDSKGKNIGSLIKGYSHLNKEIEKGKIKIMVTPDEKCKISFSIPD